MTDVLRACAEFWWSWVASMSLQLAVLVAAVALLDRLVARWAWPQLRASLWLLVFVKLVLPPTLAAPTGIATIGSSPAALPAGGDAGTAHAIPFAPALFGLWLAGFLFWTVWAALRYRRVRRELLGSPAAPTPEWLAHTAARCARRLRLPRAPVLRLQVQARTPAVVGFRRPVVVLPADILHRASRQQIEHVLLHEFAHVKRCDPLRSLGCLVLQLGYWFHPLVWLARRRLSLLRELGCDQTVAAVLRNATPEYRRTLLHLSRPLLARPATPGVLGFLHPQSHLLARLEWLEQPRFGRGPWRSTATAALCALLLLCCVPLAPAPRTVQSFPIPNLSELEGCLQLRYAVYGHLARQREAADRS